jgi:aspartate/methionine/tyrosine aminotransferase
VDRATNMADRMNHRFRGLSGGLFTTVSKADVGDGIGRLMEQGYDIMAWADPFFPDPSLPPSVKSVLLDCVSEGFLSHYTMPIGDPKLRRVIADKVWEHNSMKTDPDRNILVTPGSDSGLLYAMMPFLSEGDEVLVPDPSYPSNFLNPRLCGAVAVNVPLRERDGYQIDVREFERLVTPRTKMVLMSHPNNPTGTVFRRGNLEELCEFIIKHDLILVCDQAFEDHIFDDLEFVSPATLPGMWERTVTVFSLSKGYGLSGLRVGYIVADDRIMDVLYGGAVNVLGATNTASQIAAIAALKDKTILPGYRSVFERRRRMAYDSWSSIPGVKMLLPESGFLSWLNVSRLGTDAEVASYLMKEAKVVVNEGTHYGSLGGPGHLRIVHGCFADETRARDAYDRIRTALLALSRAKLKGSEGYCRPVQN